jgi:hypothetical protein
MARLFTVSFLLRIIIQYPPQPENKGKYQKEEHFGTEYYVILSTLTLFLCRLSCFSVSLSLSLALSFSFCFFCLALSESHV